MYKIVLVEDEKLLRINIRKSMQWEKYGFVLSGEAANGEQALEVIENIRPDVVITDIRMPFMNGIELSRILVSLYSKIKIIILSGYIEFSYAQEAINLGVYEYIVKPVTPVKLTHTLMNLKETLDKDAKENDTIRELIHRLNKERSGIQLKAKNLADAQTLEKDLTAFLKQGKLEDVDRFVSNYISSQSDAILNSEIFSSYYGIKILTVCMQVIQEFGGEPEKILDGLDNINEYVKRLYGQESVKKETKNLIVTVIQYRNKIVDSSTKIIDKAKDYIEENIAKSKLTLNDVANYVGLSPNHFSFVFKQRTGSNFIKYVTEVRIQKAQDLLKGTDMTAAEIADTVGYADPNYFSSVFKRNCGMTTKEFRAYKSSGDCL